MRLGGAHVALREGAGESETCFNCVLYGIGILVNRPLLFPSLQQQGLSSFGSVCCQRGY